MTGQAESTLRTVVFGGLHAGAWGAVLAGSVSASAFGEGHGRESRLDGASISGAGPLEEWQLIGDGIELTVAGTGAPTEIAQVEPEHERGFDQLCHVRGHVRIGGERHSVDALGVRGERPGVALEECDSMRAVWAWFEPSDAMALVAIRPRKRRGHGRDAVTASVLEEGASAVVAEPRLSTTYGADGAPVRAGLELWLEEEGEQYPRRASGATIGAGDPIVTGRFELRPVLMRWRARGRDGAGIYLLVRTR